MPDSVIERVARKLCSLDGFPEDIRIDGRPMWVGYANQARGIIDTIREPSAAMVQSIQSDWRAGADPDVIYRSMIDTALAEDEYSTKSVKGPGHLNYAGSGMHSSL